MKWKTNVVPVTGDLEADAGVAGVSTPEDRSPILPRVPDAPTVESSQQTANPLLGGSATVSTPPASESGSKYLQPRRTQHPPLRLPHGSTYVGGEGLDVILKARDEGKGCCNATDYWPETLFSIRGRSFPLWPMVCYCAYSTVAVCAVIFSVTDFKSSGILQGLNEPLQNVGYALFLLLTFRTQSVYDRWWEGRRQLGTVTHATRDIGRYCVSKSLCLSDKELAERLIRWTIAFVTAVKCNLRREQEREDFVELNDVLSPTELLEMLAAAHKPSYVSWRLSTYLAAFGKSHSTDGTPPHLSQVLLVEGAISKMVAAASACERIKNTPMPFAIVVHMRSFLVLWLAAIPFVFVASLQWLTIGFCVIVGYALLGFESFGVEIESPFGRDFNDLPMDKIADGIKANLMGALEFLHTTDETGVIVSRQKLTQTRSRRKSVHIDVWGVPEPGQDLPML